jgi:hypothetical protein
MQLPPGSPDIKLLSSLEQLRIINFPIMMLGQGVTDHQQANQTHRLSTSWPFLYQASPFFPFFSPPIPLIEIYFAQVEIDRNLESSAGKN